MSVVVKLSQINLFFQSSPEVFFNELTELKRCIKGKVAQKSPYQESNLVTLESRAPGSRGP